MERHIQQGDGVGQRKPAREVCNGPNRARDAKTTPDRRLGGGNAAAADNHPDEPRGAACAGHCGLDRAAWRDVETVKPGRAGSGENRRVRQTELCSDQPRHGPLGDLMPGIQATTQAPPARAEQLRSRYAMPARLFDRERTLGQVRRNARSRRHAENAGRCPAQEQRRVLRPSVGCARYQGIPISNGAHSRRSEIRTGAGDGLRTRYLDLGKVALYQVSYSRSDRGSILPGRAPSADQAAVRVRQGIRRLPHRSRSAFTRIADSWSLAQLRRPDSTAARTAAIAWAS